MRNKKEAAVIGLLAVGGLAAANHVAEVGMVDAAGDLASVAGDLVDSAVDAARHTGYALQEASEVGTHATSTLQDAPGGTSVDRSHGCIEDLEINWSEEEFNTGLVEEGLDILENLF